MADIGAQYASGSFSAWAVAKARTAAIAICREELIEALLIMTELLF
ncbi:hypothetical protein BL107_11426 [Synechococcus sp. BL107]|nr:hypothetical protein BL107_11426 [Synechococcus sp. BL107]